MLVLASGRDFLARPAAAKRLVDRDQIGHHQGAGLGQLILGIQKGILRLQDIDEADQAGAILILRDRECSTRSVNGGQQRYAPVFLGSVARQRVFHIAQGAKPIEVEGLVKPVAARLMGIALPGQILMSGIAHTLALRARSELGEMADLRWLAHGNYHFKGLAESVDVYEVGERGVAPFKPPARSSKAHRQTPWWRRPGVLAWEVLTALLLLTTLVYLSFHERPAVAFAQRDWVVVGDLANLTVKSVFDDSLQTAFRLGLEESRYVNVLSKLMVSDALQRMQRNPEQTRIDRSIGSEVAIREGARALILPTVAEIG